MDYTILNCTIIKQDGTTITFRQDGNRSEEARACAIAEMVRMVTDSGSFYAIDRKASRFFVGTDEVSSEIRARSADRAFKAECDALAADARAKVEAAKKAAR